jgi:hypothetical protein
MIHAPTAEPAKRNAPRRKKMDVFDLIAVCNLLFVSFVAYRVITEAKAWLNEKEREARRYK